MADIEATMIMPSGGGEPEVIEVDGEELVVGATIRHLHPWVRFVIKSEAESIDLKKPPDKPQKVKTKTDIVLIHIDYADDNTPNRRYRKQRTEVILADRPVYLKIFDKKGTITASGPPNYQFIDILEKAIAEERV